MDSFVDNPFPLNLNLFLKENNLKWSYNYDLINGDFISGYKCIDIGCEFKIKIRKNKKVIDESYFMIFEDIKHEIHILSKGMKNKLSIKNEFLKNKDLLKAQKPNVIIKRLLVIYIILFILKYKMLLLFVIYFSYSKKIKFPLQM